MSRGRKSRLRNRTKPGTWLVSCDVCAHTVYNIQTFSGVSETQRGLVVCSGCYEPEHQLVYSRARSIAETQPTWPVTGETRISFSQGDESSVAVDDWGSIGLSEDDG